jgi:hypothetical protein
MIDRTVNGINFVEMSRAVFYGLQGRWTGFDRLFKLFVTRDGIAGAYVAGQVYDEASGAAQLVNPARVAGPLMAMWVRRLIRKRAERELMYDAIQPGSAEFMAADSRNFLLNKSDIEQAVLKSKRSLWASVNCGTVTFQLWSGKRLKFVLAGEQDLTQIERTLIDALGKDQVKSSDRGS